MARIRTIKPDFFKNEELAEMPAMNRLLFIGLWTQADREGRLLDRPKRLKAEIFPYDNYDVDKGLNQLFEAGLIIRYKTNVNISDRVLVPEQPETELAIIQIINFLKHQKIDKANEKESELPEPYPQDYKKTITSLEEVGEGKGKEGKGKEGESVLVFPFESENFKKFWNIWKEYKTQHFKFNFKTIVSEQAALKELGNLSKNNEGAAIQIIEQSIAKGWKGLFELKNNGSTKNQQSTYNSATRAAELYKMYSGAAGSDKA